MSLYDNAFPSNYDEIRTFYPVWYFDVLEMDAIWRATGRQLDGIQSGVLAIVDNNFIASADEPTIASLERFLYIKNVPGRTLDERRKLVASFFIPRGHIGAPEIKEIVRAFTEGEIDVGFSAGRIFLSVFRTKADQFNPADCLYVLLSRIPAHLALIIEDAFEHEPVSTEIFVGAAQNGVHSRTTLPELILSHSFSDTVFLGGGQTGQNSRTQLRQLEMEHHFSAKVFSGAGPGSPSSRVQLHQLEPEHRFSASIFSGAAPGGIRAGRSPLPELQADHTLSTAVFPAAGCGQYIKSERTLPELKIQEE